MMAQTAEVTPPTNKELSKNSRRPDDGCLYCRLSCDVSVDWFATAGLVIFSVVSEEVIAWIKTSVVNSDADCTVSVN